MSTQPKQYTDEHAFGGKHGMTIEDYASIQSNVPGTNQTILNIIAEQAQLRDIASQAMAGILSGAYAARNEVTVPDAKTAAKEAVGYAIALLKELAEIGPFDPLNDPD